MPTTIDLDTAHQDEWEVIAEEGSSKVVLDAEASGGIEFQSELEQETLPSAQEAGVDALTDYVVETEVEAGVQGTDAATTSKNLAAVESPETKQPVVSTTEVFISSSCVTHSLTRVSL